MPSTPPDTGPTPSDGVRRLDVGFRTRLFVVSVALMVVFVLATGVWLETSLRPLLEAQAITELEGSATLARAAVSEHVDAPSDVLTDQLRGLSEAADLRLTLIDPSGTVKADSSVTVVELGSLAWHGDRPEVKATLAGQPVGVSRRYSDTLDEERVYVAVPIAWNEAGTGSLRVSRTTARADAPIFAIYRLLLVALVGGCCVALMMTWLAATSMDRDLGVLLRHTTLLASGETVAPLRLQSSVALAGIAGSVDQMAHETQRVLRALADERKRSAAVLGVVREGLFSIDREDRLTLVNPACAQSLGLTNADLGRRVHRAVDCPPLIDLIDRARTKGEQTGDIERPGSDGSEGPTILQARVLPGGQGGFVVSLSDITHLRRLETIRRDFVANVSHEVRTPISIVQASAEALQDGAIEDPRYSAQFLDAILRNTDRLVLLTKDILQLSRIEAGQSIVALEPVVVSDVVIDVIEILHQRSRVRKQRVVSTVGPAISVVADAGSLEQVLVNLLENAMKYTPKKGTIRVSTAPGADDRIRILVADHGPGIPAVHRPRLFERFYRVDPGRSREEGGTGLGLAIVKHLAESMGGAVGMEPNVPTGAIFWFELPALPLTVDSPAAGETG